MEGKKRPHFILYTILMSIVFIVVTNLLIWGYGGSFLVNSIIEAPQGILVISEIVLAALVLIVMLLFGNSYVFTQKKEKISKGLFYGLFYIIGFSIFTLISGLGTGGFQAGLPAIVNLLIGCFFIGVAEEFLCRGWLLNEFLERYGNTKKGIWASIIISGSIFGLMHLGNIFTGQAVLTTITQVINASAIGILFGLIYYKTKNIWSVVILHCLWDFSLMLMKISPVTSAMEVIPNFSYIGLTFTILLFLVELLNIIPYIKNIDEEPKKGSVILFSTISFVLYFIFMLIIGIVNTKYGDTYKFDSISIDKYSVVTDNYDNYFMNNGSSLFELYKNKNDNLVLVNKNTNYSVEFECESLYDYLILEEENYYIIGYVDYEKSFNPFLYYKYINKVDLSNENVVLDNIKSGMKKYLLSTNSELQIINDRGNNISYLSAYSKDYGHYLLVKDGKMSILNRD